VNCLKQEKELQQQQINKLEGGEGKGTRIEALMVTGASYTDRFFFRLLKSC